LQLFPSAVSFVVHSERVDGRTDEVSRRCCRKGSVEGETRIDFDVAVFVQLRTASAMRTDSAWSRVRRPCLRCAQAASRPCLRRAVHAY
jgi:hypothetical protein